MKNYKYFKIFIPVFLLSGCLATTNLLTDGTLDYNDQNIANMMAERAVKYCVTFSENSSDGNRSGDMPISKLPEFKAFYTANDNWYKADVLTTGNVWFSIYFNSKTNRFTCGKSWEKYSESRTVQFIRKDVKEKSINDIALRSIPKPQQNKSTENKLIEAKSLFDKNLITSQQYDEQVKRILANQ
ncbi:hypothetical protein [Rhodoferax sp.]|uniref:hypothetical protein n=1 Tax=Rhodoferax sp. TaxID=50421 RepID=UPI00263004A8|nr:hypothetical protein [Rhodoferax sp.]MDD5480591.1 hypothetical protein [Rhodoferax sp.]